MSNWSRFRELNGTVNSQTQEVVNSHFLLKGYPSITITGTQGLAVQAVVVNKQEQEVAYIYTLKDTPLDVGSVWTAKNLHLLITEEITVIKDVNWHKYHCFLCNLEVDGLWGYFIGPEKKHIDLQLHKQVVLTSTQKPLLILAGMPLKFQDKIMIHGRAWVVDEYDALSTPGITYYSLLPTTMSKEVIADHPDTPIFTESYNEPVLETVIDDSHTTAVESAPGIKITVTTEDGYFKSNISNLKIYKHTPTEVIFETPFGIEELIISTKVQNVITERIYHIGY